MDIEQDKRHMATAMVFLGGMMLVATIIMFVLAAVKPQTFNNINGGQTDRIAKVASDWKRRDNDETLELVSVFEKAKYTSYRGELGSTACETFTFYDEKNKELFRLTDVGNRNIVIVQLPDGSRHLYQAHYKE